MASQKNDPPPDRNTLLAVLQLLKKYNLKVYFL